MLGIFDLYFSLYHIIVHRPHGGRGLRIRTSFGKETISLEFFTRLMPCMTELHSLFYPENVKIVPHNIYDLLTPVALAHLIMGDGDALSHGLIICTNGSAVADVIRLMNVLMIRYRLECNIRIKKRRNGKIEHMIFIRQRSMSLLRTIVNPFFHPSMYYKILNELAKS